MRQEQYIEFLQNVTNPITKINKIKGVKYKVKEITSDSYILSDGFSIPFDYEDKTYFIGSIIKTLNN